MKFRSILIACAFLMAIVGSVGFKTISKRPYSTPGNYYYPPFSLCVTSSTDQVVCETFYEGAQCTITFNGHVYPAWQYMTGPVKNCTVPIKRPV